MSKLTFTSLNGVFIQVHAISVRLSLGLPFFLFLVILNVCRPTCNPGPSNFTLCTLNNLKGVQATLRALGYTFHGPFPLFFPPSLPPHIIPFPFFPLETDPLNNAEA